VSITLLISTFNRTPLLNRSLARLLTFTPPEQIIIVDDGSSDGCEETCWHYTQQGLPITYIYLDRPFDSNPCLPRNIGIKLATTTDILVTEPEILFLTDIVDQTGAARSTKPEDILYGRTYHEPAAGATLDECETIDHFPFYSLYKREWLEEVGGYDEAFPEAWGWEDVDLNGRLAEIGHHTVRIDGCAAVHQWHPSRVNEAVEQERHARAKRWPQDIEANQEAGSWGVIPST
jgi:GT2 family glycosyltransferase